ncbi:MAG: response regulator [Lachnospiraceae bacterium]|nr:response regulator [Lachnospiraceae bacterium]
MYRILIAEDEEDVRNGIVKWINESGTEFHVAGAAKDGAEALKLLKELEPDILVTDICMPKVNGLELIEEVRRLRDSMPVIVVSGYDEFSYARAAMQMGVREYLLKPFLPRDLVEVLEKARGVLEEKNQLEKNLLSMSEQIEAGKRYRKERLLGLILEGREEEAGELTEEFRFPSGNGWYGAAVIREEQEDRPVKEELMEQYLGLILESYMEPDIRILGGSHGKNRYVLLFGRQGQSRNRLQQDIRNGMERICLGMEQHHGIRLRCAVGQVYGAFSGLSQSYEEACDLWRGKLHQEQRVIVYAELAGQGETASDLKIEEQLQNQLLAAVRRGREKAAGKELDKLMEYYASFSIEQIEYISISLVKLVLQISDAVSGAGEETLAWKDDQVLNYLKHHFVHGSLLEAKAVLESYIEKCCQQFARRDESDGARMVREAKAVIEQRLCDEEFSLELLADELHFSSNYVRRVFKAETGSSFSDYLQKRRMEQAGELLKHSDRRIQEISELVGYSNQQYFARSFKKFYGCTPTAFREDGGAQ